MMEFLGVKPKRVAFYAGLTSAIFSLCQFLTGVAWGRASDMVGRKPIVLLGVTWSMLTSLAFGLSTTLTWAITSRALGGLGSGNVGVLRTMVAEMVPYKELQPRAFSIMPLVWTVGSILGPAFGGSLANPVEKIPGLFGKSRFLTTFPYALPNMVAGVFFMFGLTAGFLFLKVRVF
jgi:MFS family permease